MIERKTILSEDRVYRYTLWREWCVDSLTGCGDDLDLQKAESFAMFIGLNPSTADETQDDPTIRRCVGFARAWGYGALCMTNLFAFRATDPKQLRGNKTADGYPVNDHWLLRCAQEAGIVVAAWGTHGRLQYRADHVYDTLRLNQIELFHLGLTREGFPKHPLYLKADTKPERWIL